jgi:exonuclease VII small subunit
MSKEEKLKRINEIIEKINNQNVKTIKTMIELKKGKSAFIHGKSFRG